MRFPDARFSALLLTLFVALAASPAAGQAVPNFAEPGVSPDGSEIAFVSGGDIWTVAASGGEARLLIAHSATESRPLYSPDGRWLAFNSDREGSDHVWLMDLESGAVERLTVQDGTESLNGWSPDSEWVYSSSSRLDIRGQHDIFRVRRTGGTPMPVLADRFGSEFFAAPGTQDRILMSTRGRSARNQWWRNGHSHMDEAEIWMATIADDAGPTYVRISAGGKNAWPMWGQDRNTVYWVSDRDGAENLWSAPATEAAAASPLTAFTDGRVLWPTISKTGDVIAFERDFAVWTWSNGQARRVPITLRGSVESPKVDFRSLSSFSELAMSPDGKKAGLVARGEVFAAHADSGGPAFRVTRTAPPESQLSWDSDSRRLAYVSTRGEYAHVFVYDFTTHEERQVTSGDSNHAGPEFAPEGGRLLALRDGDELLSIDVDSGDQTVVARGNLAFSSVFAGAGQYAWSPDGEWIAFLAWPNGEFGNVHVVSAEGGQARPVSFVPNVFSGGVTWSPDGRSLFFTSSQRTEDTNVFRVDLVPQVPLFREDAFTSLFEEEMPSGGGDEAEAEEGEADEAPAVEIDFDGIRQRMSIVPTRVSVNATALSPDGKTLVVSGNEPAGQHLYAIDLDPLATGSGAPRQITSSPGFRGSLQFTPDGRALAFLQGGRLTSLPLSGGSQRTVEVSAEVEVDFDAEKMDVFLQAWRTSRDSFYDEDMHGADWDEVRERWEPQVAGAETTAELRRLLQLMVGELNGSHLGAGGGNGIETTPSGYLGLHFDRIAHERDGGFLITEIVPLSPADVADEVEVGDYLVSVNGTTVGAATNLDELFLETVGERVEVGFADSPDGDVRTVAMKPISNGQEAQLRYRGWVEDRRAYVERESGGRLGYVHIPDMGSGSLAQLYLDLDRENHDREGVVVDVRNNNGGFVNAYALDVFTRRNYFSMRPRGGESSPSRVQLGQRALLAPTVLVTNQNTLSDGEDFTEGYRALELGPVVGEPTAGWIIYTSNIQLFDGTSYRVPFIEVRGAAGDVMELNPRPVDFEVERPAGESYSGRDIQLDRAIEALLARIGG